MKAYFVLLRAQICSELQLIRMLRKESDETLSTSPNSSVAMTTSSGTRLKALQVQRFLTPLIWRLLPAD